MSIFKNIMSKIFGARDSSPQSSSNPSSTAATQPAEPGVKSAPPTEAVSTAPATSPSPTVDVEVILNDMASKNSEKLDWKKSIVDLMKLLDLDSSLSSRKELATELDYTGDKDDSATMNVWLHKQVLKRLSENGGKVPADLLD